VGGEDGLGPLIYSSGGSQWVRVADLLKWRSQWVIVADLFKWGRRWVRPAGLLKWGRAYGRFKPGTFFVSSIILQARHELKSEAARRSDLLDHLPNTKNNKASDVVSKRHQQL